MAPQVPNLEQHWVLGQDVFESGPHWPPGTVVAVGKGMEVTLVASVVPVETLEAVTTSHFPKGDWQLAPQWSVVAPHQPYWEQQRPG